MLLGFSLTPFGHHPSAWREGGGIEGLSFAALLSQLKKAEDAGFDFALLPDLHGARPRDALSSTATPFEPTTLVAALAARLQRIGLLAAAATFQHEPYNLARRFASLDQISQGRSGWLAIPSTGQSAREREYVDLVRALWDSFEDDAFIYDKQNARFFEPGKMHVLNHRGEHFSVRGPLNVNRSPQGRPVIAQLLTAENYALAAELGEVVLLQEASAQRTVEAVRQFEAALKAAGRSRGDVRLLSNVVPFAAATREMAQAQYDSLQSDVPAGLVPIGSFNEVADTLQTWQTAAKIDGFAILPPTLSAAEAFVADVVPELRKRRLLEPKPGKTLRSHLGLARPSHPATKEERAS